MNNSSKNSKIIRAPKAQVYNAFTNKNALEYWLAPNNMIGNIHSFDLRIGGGYNMSLFYLDNDREGKTAENEDRFSVRFMELRQLISSQIKMNFQAR